MRAHALICLPLALWPGVSQASGFLEGFAHPILGLDHLLAMALVGLLSVQIGGRAIWITPAAFVLVMAAGGALGMAQIVLPQIEGVIALSVFALGAVIAAGASPPIWAAIIGVGGFALFHGLAHGLEAPKLAEPLTYALGFLIATAIIHILGVAIGEACRLAPSAPRLRALLGAGAAGVGLHMLLLTYEIF